MNTLAKVLVVFCAVVSSVGQAAANEIIVSHSCVQTAQSHHNNQAVTAFHITEISCDPRTSPFPDSSSNLEGAQICSVYYTMTANYGGTAQVSRGAIPFERFSDGLYVYNNSVMQINFKKSFVKITFRTGEQFSCR